MKILFTSSECVPFVKTGGLADVVGALAPVLAKKGHDVRVVLPLYTAIDSQVAGADGIPCCHFEVQLGWRRQYCGVNMLKKDGVTYYFLDNKYLLRPSLYLRTGRRRVRALRLLLPRRAQRHAASGLQARHHPCPRLAERHGARAC